VLRGAFVPLPSWPEPLPPQQATVPFERSPQVWSRPAARFDTGSGALVTGSGGPGGGDPKGPPASAIVKSRL
jgi:hypothetical protein